MGRRDRVCGEPGPGRGLVTLGRGQVAAAQVAADPSQLECLVAGQALRYDSQQGPADVRLDGRGGLLGGGKRLEAAPGRLPSVPRSRRPDSGWAGATGSVENLGPAGAWAPSAAAR